MTISYDNGDKTGWKHDDLSTDYASTTAVVFETERLPTEGPRPGLTYLANPYRHPSEAVQDARMEAVSRVAAGFHRRRPPGVLPADLRTGATRPRLRPPRRPVV